MIKWILFAIYLSVLTACKFEGAQDYPQRYFDGNEMLEKLIKQINFEYPGRGLADYPTNESTDVPKGFAMILLGSVAEAKLKKIDRINEFGTKAGNWLLENADANKDGVIGWGVPVAWDAYGDGSINPANTEYAISTAIVIDALLDWFNFVEDEKKLKIQLLIEKALEPYLEDNKLTPAGLLPYSLKIQDRRYDTFNSAAYLAGQMQRYSLMTLDPSLKKKLQSTADATMMALIKHKKNAPQSNAWYWNYSIQEENPNDLPHAGYIVEGIFIYIENQGRLSTQLNNKKILLHMMDFIESSGNIRGWPLFRPEITTSPRLYDLSIASQLMCRYKNNNYANLFLSQVKMYEHPNGGYLKYPIGTENNRQVAEYEANLYRALMVCKLTKSQHAE